MCAHERAGETFELDRRDEEGSEYRLVGEQVSHYPPRSAMNVESERHGWVCFQDFSSEMKLAGTQMVLRPIGARASHSTLQLLSYYTRIRVCFRNSESSRCDYSG